VPVLGPWAGRRGRDVHNVDNTARVLVGVFNVVNVPSLGPGPGEEERVVHTVSMLLGVYLRGFCH